MRALHNKQRDFTHYWMLYTIVMQYIPYYHNFSNFINATYYNLIIYPLHYDTVLLMDETTRRDKSVHAEMTERVRDQATLHRSDLIGARVYASFKT